MVDGMTQSIKLDDLISAIVKVHDDPLDQLQDAALAAQHSVTSPTICLGILSTRPGVRGRRGVISAKRSG